MVVMELEEMKWKELAVEPRRYPMTDSQLSLVSLASDSELRSGEKSKKHFRKKWRHKRYHNLEILNKKSDILLFFKGPKSFSTFSCLLSYIARNKFR